MTQQLAAARTTLPHPPSTVGVPIPHVYWGRRLTCPEQRASQMIMRGEQSRGGVLCAMYTRIWYMYSAGALCLRSEV